MNTQIKETYFMNHINPNRVRIFSSSIVKIGEVQLSGEIGGGLKCQKNKLYNYY